MSTTTVSDYDLEQTIAGIVAKYEARATALIMVLQDVQSHYRYLPREAVDLIAERMNLPVAQVFGVATFYRTFSLHPKGRNHICVCTGTACHVRQANIIIDRLERRLGIKAGETTEDGEFSYETVNCLGACALAPLVTSGEDFHGHMNVAKLERLLGDLKEEVTP